MRHILVVDDHPLLRKAACAQIAEAFPALRISQAATAAEALAVVSQQDVEGVMLDINLPDRSGLSLLGELLAIRPGLKISIFSQHREPERAVACLRGGAHSYLSKSCSADEFVAALQALIEGRSYVQAELARGVVLTSLAPPHRSPLSEREQQILRMLSDGLDNKSIAHQLGLSPKTVTTHRTRIMEKLQLTTTAELIRYAVSNCT